MKVRITVFLEPENNEGYGSMQVAQSHDVGPWTWSQLGRVLAKLDAIGTYLDPGPDTVAAAAGID